MMCVSTGVENGFRGLLAFAADIQGPMNIIIARKLSYGEPKSTVRDNNSIGSEQMFVVEATEAAGRQASKREEFSLAIWRAREDSRHKPRHSATSGFLTARSSDFLPFRLILILTQLLHHQENAFTSLSYVTESSFLSLGFVFSPLFSLRALTQDDLKTQKWGTSV